MTDKVTGKVTSTRPAARSARAEFLIPDLATLLLSIVLALAVWWIAIDQENPLVVQDFRRACTGFSAGSWGEPGRRRRLEQRSSALAPACTAQLLAGPDVSDFRATLDLTGLGPGEHDVTVQVKSLDPQVGIIDVQRPELRVTLDTLSVKRGAGAGGDHGQHGVWLRCPARRVQTRDGNGERARPPRCSRWPGRAPRCCCAGPKTRSSAWKP